MDDEYFRNIIAMSFGPEHPEAVIVVKEKMRRSIQRRPQIAQTVFKEFGRRPYYSYGGIYVGEQYSGIVDTDRLDRSLTKVVKGLFYLARSIRLPDTYEVVIFRHPKGEFFDQLMKVTEGMCPEMNFGDNVFQWRFCGDKEDSILTYWRLDFYEQVSFWAITLPKDHDFYSRPERYSPAS